MSISVGNAEGGVDMLTSISIGPLSSDSYSKAKTGCNPDTCRGVDFEEKSRSVLPTGSQMISPSMEHPATKTSPRSHPVSFT